MPPLVGSFQFQSQNIWNTTWTCFNLRWGRVSKCSLKSALSSKVLSLWCFRAKWNVAVRWHWLSHLDLKEEDRDWHEFSVLSANKKRGESRWGRRGVTSEVNALADNGVCVMTALPLEYGCQEQHWANFRLWRSMFQRALKVSWAVSLSVEKVVKVEETSSSNPIHVHLQQRRDPVVPQFQQRFILSTSIYN